MGYVICREMGRLTLFHYYLANDGGFYVATNDTKKFEDKKSAIEYAQTMLKHWPDLILYVLGPRKGQTRIKTSNGKTLNLAPCMIGKQRAEKGGNK